MDNSMAQNRINIIPFLKRWNSLNFILGSFEILAVAFAFQCSYFISYSANGGLFLSEKDLLILFLLILPFWLLILYLIKVTRIPTKRYQGLFLLYLQSTILILFLLVLIFFLFELYSIPRLFLLELPFFGFLFLFIGRILMFKAFKNSGVQGYNHINIVIIANDSSLPFIESHLSKEGLGYRIVVIFTESSLIKAKFEIILPEKYLGILYDLIEVDSIDEVLYLKDKLVPSEIRETVKSCEELGVTLRLRYNDQKNSLSSAISTNLANGKFLSFINIPHNSFALAIKKSMDINLSLSMIVILSPLFIIISILIKMTSRGPVICRREMIGSRGHQFYLYKFRTMILNADQITTNPETKIEMDGNESKIKASSRFTKIGKFLRKSGLDELPQLFNVLKGEMSMIGHRHTFKNGDQ
jgi:lipopolysaccharide/colanic/teichoic acid biosynthesis glycosyltransferase